MNLEVDPELQATPGLQPKQGTQPHSTGLLPYRTVRWLISLILDSHFMIIYYGSNWKLKQFLILPYRALRYSVSAESESDSCQSPVAM